MRGRLPIAILVAAGGAAGASLRWAVVAGVGSETLFPWATLAVNAIGSVLLGALAGRDVRSRALAGTGFAAGLTTFSTFAVETAALLDRGELVLALSFVGASVASGAAGVVAGRRLAPC